LIIRTAARSLIERERERERERKKERKRESLVVLTTLTEYSRDGVWFRSSESGRPCLNPSKPSLFPAPVDNR